jgi:hypothetical protein
MPINVLLDYDSILLTMSTLGVVKRTMKTADPNIIMITSVTIYSLTRITAVDGSTDAKYQLNRQV